MNTAILHNSIKQHEGYRAHIYKDSVGKWTIGYGRNLSDNGLSEDEAEYLLSNDILSAIHEAEQQPWWPSVVDNDARARALCELVFSLGIPRLNGFIRALGCLSGRDFEGAAAEFKASKWHTQVGHRAEILEHMIEYGKDL